MVVATVEASEPLVLAVSGELDAASTLQAARLPVARKGMDRLLFLERVGAVVVVVVVGQQPALLEQVEQHTTRLERRRLLVRLVLLELATGLAAVVVVRATVTEALAVSLGPTEFYQRLAAAVVVAAAVLAIREVLVLMAAFIFPGCGNEMF